MPIPRRPDEPARAIAIVSGAYPPAVRERFAGVRVAFRWRSCRVPARCPGCGSGGVAVSGRFGGALLALLTRSKHSRSACAAQHIATPDACPGPACTVASLGNRRPRSARSSDCRPARPFQLQPSAAQRAAHWRSAAGAATRRFLAADGGSSVRFHQPRQPGAAQHGLRRHRRGCWHCVAIRPGRTLREFRESTCRQIGEGH